MGQINKNLRGFLWGQCEIVLSTVPGIDYRTVLMFTNCAQLRRNIKASSSCFLFVTKARSRWHAMPFLFGSLCAMHWLPVRIAMEVLGVMGCWEAQVYSKRIVWRCGHYFVHSTLSSFLWGKIYSVAVTHFIFLKSIEYSPGLIVLKSFFQPTASPLWRMLGRGRWEAVAGTIQSNRIKSEGECRQETKTPNSLDCHPHKSKCFQVTFTAPLPDKQASPFSLSYISLPFFMAYTVCE